MCDDANKEQRQPDPPLDQTEYWRRDLLLKEQALQNAQNKSSPDTPQAQKDYWEKDLRLKRISLGISFFGFIAVLVALHFNYEQSKAVEKSLANNVQQGMTKLTMDLDRLTIDHPELRPYLEGNANPDNDSTNKDRAVEGAIMTFDVFDVALYQMDAFKAEWSDPSGWTNWIVEDFRYSPFLRQEYQKYASWYGTNLTDLMIRSSQLPGCAQYETNQLPKYP
jgi:hypothetical protein